MNRLYTQFRYGLEKKVVDLYVKATIGASGAPTLVAASSKGIRSIARNSTGKYTVTLSDKYYACLMVQTAVVDDSGDPGVTTPVVRSTDVGAATPTVVVEFLADDGSATELASGTTLLLKLELKATSV